MSELSDLYQEVVLEHGKRPRNFRRLDESADGTSKAEGHNPLCGDRVTVYVRVGADGTIEDAAFQGSGCAISTASASLMTERLKGLRVDDVAPLFERFHDLVTGRPSAADDEALGKLAAFAGVSEFPMRVKCATLAWHTLKAALAAKGKGAPPAPVSTEAPTE
jgi:nitrogen fixation NifU-like protein